jgi:hypothetical protein
MLNEKWLNLACGNNKIEHRDPITQEVNGFYFGIDIKKTESCDIVMDLEDYPWDIESESAEEIICSHYVEHTPMDTFGKRIVKTIVESNDFNDLKSKILTWDFNAPSDGLILFMDEVYRILKTEVTDSNGETHGGRIKIIAPYYTSIRCWQDPTHRRAIGEATFFYFNKQWRNINKLEHYNIVSDFDFNYGHDIHQDFISKHDEARNYAIIHSWNIVNDIHVTLTKRKLE